MERETGIGPATNSLEGCDSTIELLPHSIDLLYFSSKAEGLINHQNGEAMQA